MWFIHVVCNNLSVQTKNQFAVWALPPGTVFISILLLICVGFVYCHCTGRRAVLDNTHGKESSAFR